MAEVLTSIVTKTLDGYVDEDASKIIQALLNSLSPLEIEKKLDQKDVSKDDETGFGKFYDVVGEVIKDCFMSCLTTNPAHYFKVGERVGYLRDDDVYILVQILKEIPSTVELGFNFGKRYLVSNSCLHIYLILFHKV